MGKHWTTKKSIRESENKLVCIGCGNLQNLLRGIDPFAYSTRVEGWACDYYWIPRGICLCDGYAPIGKKVDYDFLREYDKVAERLWEECDGNWEVFVKRRDALLADFAGDIEVKYFTRKRKEKRYEEI